MKLLNFTFIKLTICLVLGILLAYYITISYKLIAYSTIGLITLLSIYWVILIAKKVRKPYFGLLVYLSTICIGAFTYTIQNDTIKQNHYSHFFEQKNKNQPITFYIEERLKPDAYNAKYIVSIRLYNQQKVSGKLLINVARDSLAESLNLGDVFFTSATITPIQKPLNPHQFNYSKYLELRHVYHQLYIKNENLLKLPSSKVSIYSFADKLRKTINTKLKEAGFKEDVLSIINALLLGQRQDIDKRIYNNYVNSGTIHILAVSGLHIGILLLLLNIIFKPLCYLKYGQYIKPVVIVILLWSFAVIAGLSPSVTRAVTMFSIISVTMHLKRPKNSYNTLVISAFLILLFKPLFLFKVGFQLSYLAVFGIVSIQPKLYKLWSSKYLVTDKLWQIFTVTIAAQIGILPLSLFYFHQFPGLFFVSNLVIIPFLGIILGLGLLVIFLALINVLPKVLADSYSLIIDSLNVFIAWIAQFENFQFRDIPFTLLQALLSYLVIVLLVQVYKFKTFKWIMICLIGIISFQTTLFYNHYQTQTETFIVFNKSRYSMVGLMRNNQLIVHHNLDSTKRQTDNIIKNFKVGELLDDVITESIKSVYLFKDKTILVIDSIAVYKGLTFKPDYVLLRNSPKVNLNRVVDSLQPEAIIADASNYKSYIARWETTCRTKKTPFHLTSEKGAFILE